MRWNYIVGNRSRWSERQESRDDVAQRASDDLGKVGINASHLRRIAADQIVEVSIPYRKEDVGWEARILPWEYMLSAATRQYRGDGHLVVVRQLQRGGRRVSRDPKTLAIIEAAPGPLAETFNFQGEFNLVTGSFHDADDSIAPALSNPTRKGLQKSLVALHPDVIHVTGVDTHLGKELLKVKQSGPVFDGLLLRGEREPIDAVDAKNLAEILAGGQPKPLFVGFNCWNSADRLAPLAIAEGVEAAVAIQSTIDDALAEIFFVNFYRNWRESGWSVLNAFIQAFETLRPYSARMRGTSLVLWSAAPLIESLQRVGKRSGPMRTADVDDIRVEGERRANQRQKASREAEAGDVVRNLVEVIVETEPKLNYSLLHNRRSILKTFTLHFYSDRENLRRRDVPLPEELKDQRIGTIRDVQIEIVLHVGTDSFPYRTSITLEEK